MNYGGSGQVLPDTNPALKHRANQPEVGDVQLLYISFCHHLIKLSIWLYNSIQTLNREAINCIFQKPPTEGNRPARCWKNESNPPVLRFQKLSSMQEICSDKQWERPIQLGAVEYHTMKFQKPHGTVCVLLKRLHREAFG